MRPSKLSTNPGSPRRSNVAALLLLAPLFAAPFAPRAAHAQAKTEAEKPAVFCDQMRAVLLVEQQLSEAKAFENPVKRIAVMVSGADLLWPHQEERARAVFAEAFELASAHFREKGDEVRREPSRPDSPALGVRLADQRFVVLRAVGRRDAAWARTLAERAAEETRLEAEKKGKNRDSASRLTSEKLLMLAESLLPKELPAALSLARLSYRETATSFLPRFLYKLAEVDRRAADALYQEALAAYAARDLEELLHLSSYPFALRAAVGPVSGLYNVPQVFAASPALQRQFVATLLRRAGQRLAALERQPVRDEHATGRSEAETAYAVMLMLEAHYAPRDAAETARIAELKTQAAALLNAARQERAASYLKRDLGGGPPPQWVDNFDATVEQAQRHTTQERRDRFTALAIMSAPQGVKLEKVEAALQKVGDAGTRRQLSDWLYFSRAQHALKDGDLEGARKLAGRVAALDESALLSLEIAAEGLKRFADRQRADEILAAVYGAARVAPDTEAKARALIGVAHLYAKFDYVRGAEVLGEAVKTVNLLAEPDFSAAVLHRKVQGKDYSSFTSHPVPGFNLENAFRELGPHDFEGALAVARRLEDKHLLALATNALSARCLEEAPPDVPKSKETKPKKEGATGSKKS
jgi:hypothetical protein